MDVFQFWHDLGTNISAMEKILKITESNNRKSLILGLGILMALLLILGTLFPTNFTLTYATSSQDFLINLLSSDALKIAANWVVESMGWFKI